MPSPIVPGFNQNTLAANDDGSTGRISLDPAFGEGGLDFFGTNYTSLFVNNNGNVTFNSSFGSYTPFGLIGYTGNPIIAPFFADVDTRGQGSSQVTYGFQDYLGHHAFGVNWVNVGYFGSHADKLNSFQLILVDRRDLGSGDFDIYFNYGRILWETGDASGGTNGFGGVSAAAGFSNGRSGQGDDGHPLNKSFEITGSRTNGAFLDSDPETGLIFQSNTGVPGQFVFQVRNGEVTVPPPEGPPPEPPPTEPIPDPEPVRGVTFGLRGMQPIQEGNEGPTAFTFVITRQGADLRGGSMASWEIRLDDPDDLVPGQALSGQVFFPSGSSRQEVTILVQGDRVFEPDEMIEFTVTQVSFGDQVWDPNVAGGAIILNDDPQTNFVFSGPLMLTEGVAGPTPFEFTVMRTGDLTRPSTVSWQLQNGTADALDFGPDQPTSGVVTFAAGAQTATIVVQVAGDNRVELDESFTVRLTSGTTSNVTRPLDVSTTGVILDDDARQSVLVATPSALTLPEGDGGATAFNFTVLRVGDTSTAVNVPYVITLPAGGASAAEIQGPLSGSVTFAAGSAQGVITVLVTGDTTPEASENFLISVGGGEFNTLGLTGVILNDDKAVGPSAPEAPAAPSMADVSSFVQSLMGGGLWSDGVVI